MRYMYKAAAVLICLSIALAATGCGSKDKAEDISSGTSVKQEVTEGTSSEKITETEDKDAPDTEITIPSEDKNKVSGAYEYRLTADGLAEIIKYKGADDKVLIPDELDGVKVGSIGDMAFSYCQSMTEVTIPEGITKIGDNAFGWCSFLESVSISDSVKDTGANPFINCDRLKKIKVSKENKYLRSEGATLFGKEDKRLITFGISSGDVDCVVPEGTLIIGKQAFSDRHYIKKIVLPNSLTAIEDQAFERCMALTDINIPLSLRSIGKYSFSYCNSLPAIELNEGLLKISSHAFHNCIALAMIKIPDSVNEIGDNPFTFFDEGWITDVMVSEDHPCLEYEGGALYSKPDKRLIYVSPTAGTGIFTVKEGTKIIGAYAFDECKGLEGVKIPESVSVISNGAFVDCQSLEDAVIPESVNEIGDFAFAGCSGLKDINIPKAVTRIGEQTFMQCETLTSLTIPENVKEIATEAFLSCSALTEVKTGEGLKSIGDRAFGFCSALKAVDIPESLKDIGANPFIGCKELNDINVSPDHTAFKILDGALVSRKDMRFIFCSKALNSSSYEIPQGIKIIGAYAFCECTELVSVKIPSSVEGIDEAAFNTCTSLNEIELPEDLKYLETGVFGDCGALTSLKVPGSVVYIGEGAFAWCDELKLKVKAGSYAEDYCKSKNMEYETE